MRERPLYYILDDHGTPVAVEDALDWARWFEANTDKRIVARDRDEGGGVEVFVSTVFLGLDQNWLDGPPMIYESMVFGGALDQEQRRYSTREQALAGHQELCEQVKAAQRSAR